MTDDRASSNAPQASRLTAHWIAAARARESSRPDALFHDPFAAALAGSRGAAVLAASEAASGGENTFLPIRTRFFDDLVCSEADRIDQVVLLGAGFDMRAFRLSAPAQVRWFEIDAPALFAEKESVLASLGASAPRTRVVVAADLGGKWESALLAAGFTAGLRTAWIAEGLLFYLTPEEVDGLLAGARALSGSGSVFAADASGSGLLALPMMEPALRARAAHGLPPPFTTDDPRALFSRAGWPRVELADVGRLARAYGRPFESSDWVRDPGLAPDKLRTHLIVART
jgi:methyltransferase (TIGR00027 family)